MTRILLPVFLLTLLSWSCNEPDPIEEPYSLTHKTASYDGKLLHEWVDFCDRTVKENNMALPDAARLYGYLGLTAWESVCRGIPEGLSMARQINDYSEAADLDQTIIYDWGMVMCAAMETVLPELIGNPTAAQRNEIQLISSEQTAILQERGISNQVKINSREYGIRVGLRILQRLRNDGRDIIKNITPVVPTRTASNPWYWEGPAAPTEPLWSTVKTFVIEQSKFCEGDAPWAYSVDPSYPFYVEANEVAAIPQNNTNKLAAYHWEDGPGRSSTSAGHWINIARQLMETQNLNLAECAKIYCLTGLSVADATSASWYMKYRYNLLRPVTFINENINANWKPIINTPSHPEYTSSSATVAAAAAEALIETLDDISFTDNTHLGSDLYTPSGGPFVLSERQFTSISSAAAEAAESQILGGVQFRRSTKEGSIAGKCVGLTVKNRLIFGI